LTLNSKSTSDTGCPPVRFKWANTCLIRLFAEYGLEFFGDPNFNQGLSWHPQSLGFFIQLPDHPEREINIVAGIGDRGVRLVRLSNFTQSLKERIGSHLHY